MKVETKVGLLFLVAIFLIIGFAYGLGGLNLFSNHHELNVQYNFAGGIEVGSPVRVMGIKVGKVLAIDFDPNMKDAKGEEVKLRIRISVSKQAWPTVREDSRYFINLAGIIGEKFLEISPGSTGAAELKPGATVRGEDPPRIDQLISQSYGLAGKILEFVEKNEGSVTNTLKYFDQLVTNLNKTLQQLDKTTKRVEVASMLENIHKITGDLAAVSGKLRGPEADKTYDLIHRLIWRLEALDSKAIKKFLQEEGIRAKLF
ncbi:MAG TPA: MlaD family protein [Bdellovibrionales bacterium]|nr:MlaD family protein [Bdellovibrionales bacterium]